MATARKQPTTTVAAVDSMVDENGARLDVPDGSQLKIAGEHEATVGSTGPTNWWLYGSLGLAIVVAVLLLLQMFNGAPGTDMQSGTPTAEPVVETPAAPAAQ